MDNKNNNQTDLIDNNQDAPNQYTTSIKTDISETNSPLNLPKTEEKESLKDFNSTPIDTPTPTPLSDSLEPSKSLTEDNPLVVEDKTRPTSESDSKEEPTSLVITDPNAELKQKNETKLNLEPEPKPEAESENNHLLESEPEIELESVSDIESKISTNSEPEEKFIAEPETKTEFNTELKSVTGVEGKLNRDNNTEPTIQTETNLSSLPSEDPEMIKQKIAEVLSYNTASNTGNSSSDNPKVSKVIKTLFILSLIILLGIVGNFVYFFTKPGFKENSNKKTDSNPIPVLTESGVTCELNGFIYKEGQSFPSADDCNTCTCKPSGEISCTEKECVSTTPATDSATKLNTTPDIPSDWDIYINPQYKYSINYSPEWVTKTYPEYKNIIVFQTPEGKNNEEIEKTLPPGDRPANCGDYQITCYKSFTEMIDGTEQQAIKVNSLSDRLKTSLFKDLSQNTINGFTSYSTTQLGLSETKEVYIQNKDSSFCQITFCDRDLNPIEKQFVNSFKFN